MKKLIIGCGLVAAASLAFGQGTVEFSNFALEKISSGFPGAPSSTWVVVPTTPGLINYGLFYGIGESTSLTFISGTLGVNSTSFAGVIASASDSKSAITALPIPGTVAGETDVWIVIKGWSASFGTDWVSAQPGAGSGMGWFGTTGNPINVGLLGPSMGPGVLFWTTATGTNPAMHPGGFVLTTMPEPGTFALAGLGAFMLMLFHRRW